MNTLSLTPGLALLIAGCQSRCYQTDYSAHQLKFWPQPGAEPTIFNQCLTVAADLERDGVETVAICRADGVCVVYPTQLLFVISTS